MGGFPAQRAGTHSSLCAISRTGGLNESAGEKWRRRNRQTNQNLEFHVVGEWQIEENRPMREYPTKAGAWRAAKTLRDAVENRTQVNNGAPT